MANTVSRKAMAHYLKCWPGFFKAVKEGHKPFEIRKKDRDFRVGDFLVLQEFFPHDGTYSGDEVTRTITYMTDWEQKDGYVVLGISSTESVGEAAKELERLREAVFVTYPKMITQRDETAIRLTNEKRELRAENERLLAVLGRVKEYANNEYMTTFHKIENIKVIADEALSTTSVTQPYEPATNPGESCRHGIRWPHECADCFEDLRRSGTSETAVSVIHQNTLSDLQFISSTRQLDADTFQAFKKVIEYYQNGEYPDPCPYCHMGEVFIPGSGDSITCSECKGSGTSETAVQEAAEHYKSLSDASGRVLELINYEARWEKDPAAAVMRIKDLIDEYTGIKDGTSETAVQPSSMLKETPKSTWWDEIGDAEER